MRHAKSEQGGRFSGLRGEKVESSGDCGCDGRATACEAEVTRMLLEEEGLICGYKERSTTPPLRDCCGGKEDQQDYSCDAKVG
jgi:hypothetical protein